MKQEKGQFGGLGAADKELGQGDGCFGSEKRRTEGQLRAAFKAQIEWQQRPTNTLVLLGKLRSKNLFLSLFSFTAFLFPLLSCISRCRGKLSVLPVHANSRKPRLLHQMYRTERRKAGHSMKLSDASGPSRLHKLAEVSRAKRPRFEGASLITVRSNALLGCRWLLVVRNARLGMQPPPTSKRSETRP